MTNTQRGPGRPAIGGAVHVRLGHLREPVEQWAEYNGLPQAEAIRQLIGRGLVGAWPPEGEPDTTRCADEGCGHGRYAHVGRGGRCVEGSMVHTSAWRCQCEGFVEPDPDA